MARPLAEHTVSGHLKWQAHGKERMQRKLIWVDAYQRGEEILVNHEKSPGEKI